MNEFPLRSPSEKVGGLYYFRRMLDKIRLHGQGRLPPDYQPNLGKGFDRHCTSFLSIDYVTLVDRVNRGGTDEEILEWCFGNAGRPSEHEIEMWNEFARKLGWNDGVTGTLERRKKEAGLENRSDIQTMFQFIDADEGRSPVADRSG